MAEQIQNFYELEVWKIAHELVLDIYKITKEFPKEELFGLVSQMRRAAISITANIAEGFARYHFKDKIRFYYQSRASTAEVQNFLILSQDLDYISTTICMTLIEKSKSVQRLINGLIKSTQNQL